MTSEFKEKPHFLRERDGKRYFAEFDAKEGKYYVYAYSDWGVRVPVGVGRTMADARRLVGMYD